jgi:tetratricopeptide (TPR) repeat protein
MFITFYSYKGGVGRTLALANVAYLIATDKSDPCRVLVWDFDLEAPGLDKILGCKWGKKRKGFVDLVDTYLREAKIPNVDEYIYPTDVNGIDILPAGRSRDYGVKLAKLDWQGIYSQARGYDFLQALKKDIIELGYEYVLIDARTGYSDVGGICTLHLPEVVVLFFRLNNQNISGIKQVYKTIQDWGQRPEGRTIQVFPVISPAWPFASIEANELMEKAEKVFPELELNVISFESALTFGEKVICREQEEYEIMPKICEDYEGLTSNLREANPRDPMTIRDSIQSRIQRKRYDEAFKDVAFLMKRQPNNYQNIQALVDAYIFMPSERRKEYREKVMDFLNDIITQNPDIPSAYVARANLRSMSSDKSDAQSQNEALEDHTQAIQLDDKSIPAFLERGKLYARMKRYSEAIGDFSKVIELTEGFTGYLYRANCYMEMGDEYLEKAIEDYTQIIIIQQSGDIDDAYIGRLYAFMKMGNYSKVLSDADTLINRESEDSYAYILKSHSLGALGRVKEALDVLKRVESIEEKNLMSLAEAYLCLNQMGLVNELLSQIASEIETEYERALLSFLRAVVLTLSGQNTDETEKELRHIIEEKLPPEEHIDWDFTEMRVFLSRSIETGQITQEAYRHICELISFIEPRFKEDTFSYIDRLIFENGELSEWERY